jgi:hypothetical protein
MLFLIISTISLNSIQLTLGKKLSEKSKLDFSGSKSVSALLGTMGTSPFVLH